MEEVQSVVQVQRTLSTQVELAQNQICLVLDSLVLDSQELDSQELDSLEVHLEKQNWNDTQQCTSDSSRILQVVLRVVASNSTCGIHGHNHHKKAVDPVKKGKD